MDSARLKRPLRFAGLVVAVAMLVWTFAGAWAEIRADRVSVDAGRMTFSVFLLALAYLGFVALWREVLRTLGAAVAYRDTLQLWSFSNLGRYLPGKVWQVLGAAAFAKDFGLSAGLVSAAAVIAMAFSVGTGAMASLILVPDLLRARTELFLPVCAAAAGPVVLIAWPGLLDAVMKRLPRGLGCHEAPPLRRADMLRLTALFFLGWAAHGFNFCFFAGAFGGLPEDAVRTFTGAYPLAYVTGLLAVFAPGGIGVREGMLAFLLGDVAPEGLPVGTVAVGTRLWTIAAEVLVLVLAIAARAQSRRADASPDSRP